MVPYHIETGIKIPPIARPAASQTVSRAMTTLLALKKGNSFLVKDPLEAIHANKVMRDCLARERARQGTRLFTSRKVGIGIRIWRVR
jgi:hypothetical protein